MSNRKIIQKVRAKKAVHARHSTPIVFVGAGNLGGAVIKSLISRRIYSNSQVFVITATERSAQKWRNFGVSAGVLRFDVIAGAKEVWLAIKPYQIKEVAPQIKEHLKSRTLVVSLLAGWSPGNLSELLNSKRVVSVMTNTAARVNAGVYALFYSGSRSPAFAKKLCQTMPKLGHYCGSFHEKKMPHITALIGSSPAFFLHLQSQYESFAADHGVLAKDARKWFYAIQHSAQSLLCDEPKYDKLIAQIATPGGCTEKGLAELDRGASLGQALQSCTQRAKELGK
jgi:pyrroline-5-carboxylate reductase